MFPELLHGIKRSGERSGDISVNASGSMECRTEVVCDAVKGEMFFRGLHGSELFRRLSISDGNVWISVEFGTGNYFSFFRWRCTDSSSYGDGGTRFRMGV